MLRWQRERTNDVLRKPDNLTSYQQALGLSPSAYRLTPAHGRTAGVADSAKAVVRAAWRRVWPPNSGGIKLR